MSTPDPTVWRLRMRHWSHEWRREIATTTAIDARPQTWRYGVFYAEARRVINATTRRKYAPSGALAAAIRCRNRSMGRKAFEGVEK